MINIELKPELKKNKIAWLLVVLGGIILIIGHIFLLVYLQGNNPVEAQYWMKVHFLGILSVSAGYVYSFK